MHVTYANIISMDKDLLDTKKALILNAANLGMGLRKSMVATSCSEEEMAALYADKEFMAEVNVVYAEKESMLLEQLNDVISEETSKGSSTSIRWLLAHLNPRRWGDGDENKSPIAGMGTVNNHTVNYNLSNLSKEELKELLNKK